MLIFNFKSRGFFIFAAALWVIVVMSGFRVLLDYQSTAGKLGHPPRQWPVESALKLDLDHLTLLMLVHPHCPCSRASIRELEQILTHARNRAAAYVLFTQFNGFSEQWLKTDLWENAEKIPGVRVLSDPGGIEAMRFKAETSGEVLLYAPSGKLLFTGGITESRGHEGDNAGRRAVLSLLFNPNNQNIQHLVFGCPLFTQHRS